MTQHPLSDISVLDRFARTPFAPDYPIDRRRFFVTQDDVQGLIAFVVGSVLQSQVVLMYSFDDANLVTKLVDNYESVSGGMPTLIVQDQSCYSTAEGTRVAAPLVALRGKPNFRWSVGTSDKGNIMHIKSFVGDGSLVISGSTNWSNMGENDEDNECEVSISSALAAQMTAAAERIYAFQIAHCAQP